MLLPSRTRINEREYKKPTYIFTRDPDHDCSNEGMIQITFSVDEWRRLVALIDNAHNILPNILVDMWPFDRPEGQDGPRGE